MQIAKCKLQNGGLNVTPEVRNSPGVARAHFAFCNSHFAFDFAFCILQFSICITQPAKSPRCRGWESKEELMSDWVLRMPWAGGQQAGPEPLVTREWLVTNGLGGYASGTVAGLMSR